MPRTAAALCLLLAAIPLGFAVRNRAAGRLEAMVARAELGRLLSAEFRHVLVRPEISFEVRWHLERWCRRLPVVPPEPVEEVSAEQIARLLGQLDDDSYSVRVGATRRLESLLFRDANLPRMRRALEARLAAGEDAETTARLRKLLDLARPAMVAECWQGRRHVGEQHLLVGVPSMGPGASKPSHFDRIDDERAHCVSGHNLSEGDYPVGVAFPHPDPRVPGAFFHLVNLPTPRRRLEYQRHVQTDEATRLAAISRRTLDRVLAERRELSEPELVMLSQLDAKEVSRFAGRYFHVVEDAPLPQPKPLTTFMHNRAGGRPGRFGMICAQLAVDGTKEAVPGLLQAIDKRRFLPPSPAAPYRLHWLAALSIAGRDPWPEADQWLAGLIGRRDMLVEGFPQGPRLGATAAAVLLKRHGRPYSDFGLQKATGPFPRPLVDGYRFPTIDARKKLQQWWQQEKEKRKQRTATPGL
ncbi:MAG: hypothetical protein ACYSWU_07405 [Planctomycetota bacterium]|jgi:hypothetical protein